MMMMMLLRAIGFDDFAAAGAIITSHKEKKS
jgi:hypothetical protein